MPNDTTHSPCKKAAHAQPTGNVLSARPLPHLRDRFSQRPVTKRRITPKKARSSQQRSPSPVVAPDIQPRGPPFAPGTPPCQASRRAKRTAKETGRKKTEKLATRLERPGSPAPASVLSPVTPLHGGDCASPFILPLGPSMLGMGFRLALVVLMRGTPWMTRGSFMSAGSSLAGTVREPRQQI